MFTVNNTGHVIVASTNTLDYESTRSYTVVFRAENSYKGGSSVLLTMQINVADENDNPPIFPANSSRVYVAPGLAKTAGSVITEVKATDRDSGANQNISYVIADAGVSPKFLIGQYSGVITSGGLNVSDGSYLLVILAVDGGAPALTGTTTVNLIVGDGSAALIARVWTLGVCSVMVFVGKLV
ncbi:hypothetical protein DPMN_026506 [Dreissena polymorpha]|uniref:Cadherin domain-containing protein n=1 Tax=Dreissena polymorpha TaxID=45954 RepID=A0A9D4LTI0_DREPO|nr:hypothetical protein DPMN_026506 [Dreissena polymorpha]